VQRPAECRQIKRLGDRAAACICGHSSRPPVLYLSPMPGPLFVHVVAGAITHRPKINTPAGCLRVRYEDPISRHHHRYAGHFSLFSPSSGLPRPSCMRPLGTKSSHKFGTWASNRCSFWATSCSCESQSGVLESWQHSDGSMDLPAFHGQVFPGNRDPS
jgi:hypothetical protein